VYWRLLSTDPAAAQEVVLASKPVISDNSFDLDPDLLDMLVMNLSSLSSIYHKPPEFFVRQATGTVVFNKKEGESSSEEEDSDDDDDSDDEDDEDSDSEEEESEEEAPAAAPVQSNILDLSGLSLGGSAPANQSLPPSAGRVLLTADKGKGLQVSATYTRENGVPYFNLRFDNKTGRPLSQFAFKFDKNQMGFVPTGGAIKVPTIPDQSFGESKMPLAGTGPTAPASTNGVVRMAMKTEISVFYFQDRIPPHILFSEEGQIGQSDFLQMWQSLPDDSEQSISVHDRLYAEVAQIKERLGSKGVFYIASRKVQARNVTYFSLSFKSQIILLEITTTDSGCKGCAKGKDAALSKIALDEVGVLLRT